MTKTEEALMSREDMIESLHDEYIGLKDSPREYLRGRGAGMERVFGRMADAGLLTPCEYLYLVGKRLSPLPDNPQV